MAYVCRNYDEALATFALRGAVRSSKWQPNERPLDPKPVSHHRLIQGSNAYGNYFDVKLYDTIMARFYEPKVEEDGRRVHRRLYMGHGSQTSRQFMSHTLRVECGPNTLWSDGVHADERIVMPIYTKHFMHDEGVPFSLDSYWTDTEIDLSRSRHTPHYRLVADTDVRKFKQRVAQHFEPYIMLAQMRMPEFKAECKIDRRFGVKFGGEGYNRAYYMAIQEMWTDPEPRQQDIDVFFEMCQKAYDIIASKRGMEQADFHIAGTWWNRTNQRENTVDDLQKPIEANEFRRAILERIHKYVGSNSLKKPEEVKQFPIYSEYPRSNIHV
jgi:hypothetical protein